MDLIEMINEEGHTVKCEPDQEKSLLEKGFSRNEKSSEENSVIAVINTETKEPGYAFKVDGSDKSIKRAAEALGLEPDATCFEKGRFTVKMESGIVLIEKDLKKYQVMK